tara:strand:+ start:1404 stop:2726 length:1323 start_codon:yes stop_codon:yes gene_type:complete
MEKIYRVTPKDGGWIVQRKSDRKTMHKPFKKQKDAQAYELELSAKAPQVNGQANGNGKIATKTVRQAYKLFADWKEKEAQPDTGLNEASAGWYGTEYRLRISKEMPDVLLSDFKMKVMETYLDNLLKAKVPYKTMVRSVAGIKTFIRRMCVEEENPCTDLLYFSISKHYPKVMPKDNDLRYEREVEMLDVSSVKDILKTYLKEAPTKTESAYTYALVSVAYMFGLRPGEILALKKANVDFENKILQIKGSIVKGKYLPKTKNRGSTRPLDMDQNQIDFFHWWLGYLKNYSNYHKHSVWMFPGVHRFDLEVKQSCAKDQFLSYKTFRTLIWKAFARMGLADITVRRSGHAKVNKSIFKGNPIKQFRHRFCFDLHNAMNSSPLLTANYCKQSSGHTLFKTFADRYGNKKVRGTPEERAARANAKRLALKTDIVAVPKLITQN